MLIVPTGDIVRRCKGNPILTVRDVPFRCGDICNATAVRLDGHYVMLLTIQALEGYSQIYKARSTDGYTFDIDSEPLIAPSTELPYSDYNQMGVLDPRITPLDDYFYITYDSLGRHGYRLALARTKDFDTIERLGFVSQPDTKAGALFPRKFNGRYARLERPWNGGSIWISFSDDLVYWGWTKVLLTPRGGFWDSSRVGAATPPVLVEEGWLFLYYGIKDTSAGPLFRLGAAILDEHDPGTVLYRTNFPILSPREEYERIGDVPNLVFSCGAICEPNGELKIYYGAANSCICVGTTRVDHILHACHESDKEY